MSESAIDVTMLLRDVSGGSQCALEKLVPVVYEELRRLAASYLRRREATIPCRPLPWFTRHIYALSINGM